MLFLNFIMRKKKEIEEELQKIENINNISKNPFIPSSIPANIPLPVKQKSPSVEIIDDDIEEIDENPTKKIVSPSTIPEKSLFSLVNNNPTTIPNQNLIKNNSPTTIPNQNIAKNNPTTIPNQNVIKNTPTNLVKNNLVPEGPQYKQLTFGNNPNANGSQTNFQDSVVNEFLNQQEFEDFGLTNTKQKSGGWNSPQAQECLLLFFIKISHFFC